MKKRLWTIAVGLTAVAAIVAVPSALAAFTTSKLEVRQVGSTTTFKLTQSTSDDALASVRIFVPTGTTLSTTQAPGTVLGKATGLLKLFALAGAEVPVEGNVVVAPPGQIPAASQQACTQGVAPLATWLLVVSIAGNSVSVPIYLLPTAGPLAALGPAYVAACFSSPYLTPAQGGTAGQPQLVNAEFAIQGVFSPVTDGAFVAILTPYTVGTGAINTAGTVAAPSRIAAGAVSIKAKRAGLGAIVSGAVTQGGQPRGGAVVTIWGAKGKAALKPLGKAKISPAGAYTFRAKSGNSFQARVVAAAGSTASVCAQVQPLIGATPCVNPTVNGFVAKSKVVRKK
jgi:hypothetical protein